MKFSIDIKAPLREHLEKAAKAKNMKLGTYIKAVLKKKTGYKDPEIMI